MAKMSFFYGWTNDQIEDLPIDLFENYWSAITVIEAQEMLKNLTIQDWTKMKNSSREKLHRQLHRDAYPASFNEVKQVSNDELAKILGGGLNGRR